MELNSVLIVGLALYVLIKIYSINHERRMGKLEKRLELIEMRERTNNTPLSDLWNMSFKYPEGYYDGKDRKTPTEG